LYSSEMNGGGLRRCSAPVLVGVWPVGGSDGQGSGIAGWFG
jgi:hypothetical protein